MEYCLVDKTYSVGASIGGGRQNHGEVEDLANLGMGPDVVLVQAWVPVTSDMVETDLDVEDEEELVKISCRDLTEDLNDIPSCSCQDAPKEQLGYVREVVSRDSGHHTITTDSIGKASSHKADTGEEPHLEA
jgi:hypothetical protein